MRKELVIGPHEPHPAVCHEHDARSAEVARRVAALVEPHLSGAVVEHVGSTSVPGCAGKGIVDLMLLYPHGRLTAARDLLDALGFQRQRGRDPFPEDRPMRIGSLLHEGTSFNLHVHVIAADSLETVELRVSATGSGPTPPCGRLTSPSSGRSSWTAARTPADGKPFPVLDCHLRETKDFPGFSGTGFQ